MKIIQKILKKREFNFITKLQKEFKKAEIFLVGGVIRDIILNRESKDYDFVVQNVKVNDLQKFLKKLGWVDLVGKSFGVLKFLPKGVKNIEPVDIALPRTEHAFFTGGYRDFDVKFKPDLPIEEDLKRRDFTINALAYDIKKKKLIDLFDGLKDIKNKTIKTVGNPSERFQEDYSRMLRALRFACQLDFAIEPKTWQAIKKLIFSINKDIGIVDEPSPEQTGKKHFVVPREIIAKEMVKAFVADPVQAFELFDKSGATEQLMPELLKMKECPQPENFHSEGDVWVHTQLCLKNLSSKKFQKKFGNKKPSAELIFGLLFHDLGKPYTIEHADRLRFNNHDAVSAEKAEEIMERLKLSNGGVNTEQVAWLARKHMIVTHTKKSPMKKTTLEKYFFNDQVPGQDLLKIMYADIQATIPQNGRPDFTDYESLEKQIDKLKKISKQKKILPKEIINGNEIMKRFNLSSGPKIGRLKQLLREEQLKEQIKTKKQAFDFLKKHV
jgi:poly(A) polymerase